MNSMHIKHVLKNLEATEKDTVLHNNVSANIKIIIIINKLFN